MARRTLTEIQNSILLAKSQAESLDALTILGASDADTADNLTSTSKVSIWRLWVYIQAMAIWVHEGIFEAHKAEIEALIALNKLHTALWYKGKALAFQFGFDIGELDYYDNTGVDDSLVKASKIISQASVEELGGRLKIKVATLDGEVLAPIDETQKAAFTQYMSLVRDAGTRLEIISRPPDDFKAVIDIYYDPLILDGLGARLDGNNETPVKEAIIDYLYNLEFNGELIVTKLTDYLQTVEGVKMPNIITTWGRFGSNNYLEINETYIADSGYMTLNDTDTIINYIPRELL
jgi:hypothetical protein